MSSILSPYSSSPPLLSSLFKEPPEAVPPTDDLEALQNELKILKQKTLERAKKAGNDLKTIEESIRRLKEKEKGKAKAVEKVKRERACTYFSLFWSLNCVSIGASFVQSHLSSMARNQGSQPPLHCLCRRTVCLNFLLLLLPLHRLDHLLIRDLRKAMCGDVISVLITV
jgi:hypothetical protein